MPFKNRQAVEPSWLEQSPESLVLLSYLKLFAAHTTRGGCVLCASNSRSSYAYISTYVCSTYVHANNINELRKVDLPGPWIDLDLHRTLCSVFPVQQMARNSVEIELYYNNSAALTA